MIDGMMLLLPHMGTVFGPPSEPINVAAFLQSALAAESVSSTGILAELPEEQLCNVLAECRYVRTYASFYPLSHLTLPV